MEYRCDRNAEQLPWDEQAACRRHELPRAGRALLERSWFYREKLAGDARSLDRIAELPLTEKASSRR